MTELNVDNLLTVEQAIRIIDAIPVIPRIVDVALADAQGFRLSEDLRADRDYPPFDKSLMDGFAVRRADIDKLPARMRIVGEIAAGQIEDRVLNRGEAIAIMTGAPIPQGADGVVPVEATRIEVHDGQKWVVLGEMGDARFITLRGADALSGDVML